jgi:hypothetical protein
MVQTNKIPDEAADTLAGDPDKRRFLKTLGGVGLGVGLGLAVPGAVTSALAQAAPVTARARSTQRRQAAFLARQAAAELQSQDFGFGQSKNGDLTLPGYVGVFTKGLPHNDLGEVDTNAFAALLTALATGAASDLAAVPMGTPGARFVNPRAGFNFSLIGQDTQGLVVPPASGFSSAETGADMVEAYWAAMTRDVPFVNYASDATIAQAAADLSAQPGFTGPGSGGVVPDNVFRMDFPGALAGPWLSQFFWMPLVFGVYSNEQVLKPPLPGVDYSTSYADWLLNQRGGGGGPTAAGTTPRYISNARDLSRALQLDTQLGVAFQHVLQAQLNLNRLQMPRNPSLPKISPNDAAGSNFFGASMFQNLVGLASQQALQSVFWQKWQVHRRIRPEAYAGRVHNHILGAATYPVSIALLNSAAISEIFSRNGTYLLPQAWKGGCPIHPSYPSAHGVNTGAAITLLKAFYDGAAVLPNPVTANADGTALVPYSGAALTVEGELNKLAMNIGISRVQTGIHFRGDAVQGLLQGEQMAISILREMKGLYADVFSGFAFHRFDGTAIVV